MRIKIKTILTFSALCLTMAGNAQTIIPYTAEPVPNGSPDFFYEIEKDPLGVNYLDIKKKHQEWLQMDNRARVRTPDKKAITNYFRRWERAVKPYADIDGKIVLPTIKECEQQNKKINEAMKSPKNIARTSLETVASWKNIGPLATFSTEVDANTGKRVMIDSQANVYRIDVSKSNNDILYCGTEPGVVFKSVDGGRHWRACAPTQAFGSIYGTYISAIQIDPHDSDIVYVGSSQMLWKTTDGGETWNQLLMIGDRVNSIRINPTNTDIVTAATYKGLYKSINGGNSFTQYYSDYLIQDHELQPGNPDRVYALMRNKEESGYKFYVLDDSGSSMSSTSQLLGDMNVAAGRLAVTEATGGADYVYALVNQNDFWSSGNPYGGKGRPYILQSKDGGKTWKDQTSRDDSNKSLNTFGEISDELYGGNGYFDMMIGASGVDKDHVVFGLCNAYRSTQGGAGVVAANGYAGGYIGGYGSNDNMHPDIQDCAIVGDKIWISTDGGVKYSDDFFATKGEFCIEGLYASDFWGFDQGWNDDVMVGGRYHNGDIAVAQSFGEGMGIYVGGVEKGTGYVMKSNPRKVVFSDAQNRILPQNLHGELEYMHDFQKYPYEITPNGSLATDPRYAERIFLKPDLWYPSYQPENNYSLYESVDEGWSFNRAFYKDYVSPNYVVFARSNPNTIYVASSFFLRSTDNGKTWEHTPSQSRPENWTSANAVFAAVHPKNEKEVWLISESGELAKSVDGGDTWSSPLSNDQNIETKKFRWVILTGDEVNGVYLASYYGGEIWYKDDQLSEWVDYSNGFPKGATIVRFLPFYKEGKLRIGSNQGMWECPLYREHFEPTAQPMVTNLGSSTLTDPDMEVNFESYSIVNQDGAKWEWEFSPQPAYVSDAHVRNPIVIFSNKGDYSVSLKVTDKNGLSHTRTFDKMIVNPTQGTYIGPTSNIDPVVAARNKQEKIYPTLLSSGEPLHFVFSNTDEPKTITIVNIKGLIYATQVVEQGQSASQISTEGLPSGILFVEVRSKSHIRYEKIIVK